MDENLNRDIEEVIKLESNNLQKLEGKTVLVSGATGLIGSFLSLIFLHYNETSKNKINLIGLVRDKEKAKSLLGDEIELYSLEDFVKSKRRVDYIIHTISPTASDFMFNFPVETLDSIIEPTKILLENVKGDKDFKKFIYLSSMEAYGVTDKITNEEDQGYISLSSSRSSYPLGKRLAEFYCFSYFQEHKIPTVNLRLAMCIGKTHKKDDKRAWVSFLKTASRGENIVLKTSGKSSLNFIYYIDAATAIIESMFNAQNGETYNVVSDDSGKTIFDLANLIAKKYKVKVETKINTNNCFAPENKMILSNEKIKSIGWKPKYDLESIIENLS